MSADDEVSLGNAPDAVRDQMMRHNPRWATFFNAYLNEEVEFHMQNAFLDEPTEDSLIGLFTHMSLTRDPRARRDMVPDSIWRDLPADPEIVELETRRAELKNGQYRIRGTEHEEEVRELTRKIQSLRVRRDKAIREQYRQYYFYHRPTWDIERQASSRDDADMEDDTDEDKPPPIDLHIPERARLAVILCFQPPNVDAEELYRLRIEAAALQTALCSKRETVKRKLIQRRTPTDIPIKEESPEESPEPDQFPLLMQKTQCPCCIGNESMLVPERTFSYSRPAKMNDHFDREHLRKLKERDSQITCEHPKCKEQGLKLENLNHFRNHVQRVHGIRLRQERK